MVYIGNIIKEYETLADDEKLVLYYDADNFTRIFADDKIEKANGDLKVIREKPNCTVIIDCAEVKYIIKSRRFL